MFFDIEKIPSGTNFEEFIENSIRGCNVLLAIIGNYWLDADVEDDNQTDYVRAEIEAAIRLGIPVTPVLVGNAGIPSIDNLPESLQTLTKLQVVQIPAETDWEERIERFINDLEERYTAAAEIADTRRRPLVELQRRYRHSTVTGLCWQGYLIGMIPVTLGLMLLYFVLWRETELLGRWWSDPKQLVVAITLSASFAVYIYVVHLVSASLQKWQENACSHLCSNDALPHMEKTEIRAETKAAKKRYARLARYHIAISLMILALFLLPI